VGLCPFSLFFRFTTGIRNLRIHPTCRWKNLIWEDHQLADQKDLYGMSYSCLSFPINQSLISGTSVLGRPRDHWLCRMSPPLWPIICWSIGLAAPHLLRLYGGPFIQVCC
jgi:hypothetical protein